MVPRALIPFIANQIEVTKNGNHRVPSFFVLLSELAQTPLAINVTVVTEYRQGS
jgi:hypothetical protein